MPKSNKPLNWPLRVQEFLHATRRPASSPTHGRRGRAASAGAGVAGRKIRAREIWSDQWPKKASFRSFPANLPGQLWLGFTFWSSAGGALAAGPLDSCLTLADISHNGEMLGIPQLQDRPPGLASEGPAPLLYSPSRHVPY